MGLAHLGGSAGATRVVGNCKAKGSVFEGFNDLFLIACPATEDIVLVTELLNLQMLNQQQ